MTQTIEQLTARVRELEEENARLKAECDDIKQVQFPRKLEAVAVGWKKQLAAEQLNNKRLRDALSKCSEQLTRLGYSFNHADHALALPRDTSALDAYVAKRLHDMACDKGLLRIQVEELTRQRDLAVEAASDAATSLETIQLRSFGEESYLDSKPQMRAFAGARAKIARDIISTIKESEAMAQGEKP